MRVGGSSDAPKTPMDLPMDRKWGGFSIDCSNACSTIRRSIRKRTLERLIPELASG